MDPIYEQEMQYVGEYTSYSDIPQLNKERFDDAGQPVRCCLKGNPIILYGPTGQTHILDPDITDILVPAYGRAFIPTSLAVGIPACHVGILKSRSGMSKNYGIEVGAGVIDVSYRGIVNIVLYNHSHIPYKVCDGDNIAQLVTLPIYAFPYIQVDKLDETDRGSKGFGSSGR